MRHLPAKEFEAPSCLSVQLSYIIKRYTVLSEFERMTSNTLLSVEEVLQQLSVIRKCGYAVDNEELEYGLVCLGVAIMDSNNKPVGGISVSGPASRMTPENRTAFAEYLIDCGRQISSKL